MGIWGFEENEHNFVQELAMDSGERRESSNPIQKIVHRNFSPGDPDIGEIGQFSQKWRFQTWECIISRVYFIGKNLKNNFLRTPNCVI